MGSKRVLSPPCSPYPPTHEISSLRCSVQREFYLPRVVHSLSFLHKTPSQRYMFTESPIPPFIVHIPCVSRSVYAMVALGTRVMFHSALVFMSLSGSTFSICTASVICRSIASFLNVPVTLILNCCILLLWTSLQCRHRGEFFASRC